MDSILPSYKDPIFSILLIISFGLIIAVATYGWGIYRQQKERSTLHKFLEKFESAECALEISTMPFDETLFKPLALLAKAFEHSGEYHKAISIYLYLIKHTDNQVDNSDLMERLGQTYLHAGFLARAQTIFTEILLKRPRNAKDLHQLGIVYEMMQKYDKAGEVIDPLRVMGEETKEIEKYLEFKKISSDKRTSPERKIEALCALLGEEPALYRPILSLLFRLDIPTAWSRVDIQSLHSILDILWFLPYSQLDLDIISKDKSLRTIYYAKGYLEEPTHESGIFSIDMLASGRTGGFEGGDMVFSYLCKKCKANLPISFTRCPNCLAINTIEVEENIEKQSPQTDNSLL